MSNYILEDIIIKFVKGGSLKGKLTFEFKSAISNVKAKLD